MSASLKPRLLLLLVPPFFAVPFAGPIAPAPADEAADAAVALSEWPGTALTASAGRELDDDGGLIDETLKLNGFTSLLLACCCCCCDCSSTLAGCVDPAPGMPVDVWK